MLLGEGFEGLGQRVDACLPPKTALPLFGFFLWRERERKMGEKEKRRRYSPRRPWPPIVGCCSIVRVCLGVCRALQD